MFLFGFAAAAASAEDEAEFTKRGPLDNHAALVQQVLDTLELGDEQRADLKKIVAEGHAAWRAWFQQNHEKVDAHQAAVRAAKASGDKKKLAGVKRQKKAFMHTAPSLLRQPEPVRAALDESQRKLFDERLDALKRWLHLPPKNRPPAPIPLTPREDG
jgi:hypothetical protein